MKITDNLLNELQNRLKVGNRRGVHLNAIPKSSRYKFDLSRLSHIDSDLPQNFINALLSELPLKFRISWKDNVPDLNSLFEDDQIQLVNITKAFENLINQTSAIESEKGVNTFGFGFPLLARRDRADNKLTVAPILIWSLRIKRTREFNTWEILRSEDDPIYINEVLINHLISDSKIEINQISNEHLEDGLIDKNELLEICTEIINSINTTTPQNINEDFEEKLNNVKPISSSQHFENLPLSPNNAVIDFSGLFSIFEVQKQNIINDYDNLLELNDLEIELENLDGHSFQSISSVETDPSQQNILHSLNSSKNILIQGPPGTGKSQTLTAILINALENNKKTIVVCEKRTALEVLSNSLNERGLNHHNILIRDVVKDRKLVVDSVRNRISDSSYRNQGYSKETLESIIYKSRSLIDGINKKHQKIALKLIGEKNWTDVVGNFLSELKSNTDPKLDLRGIKFNYNLKEHNNILEIIRIGQSLYEKYKPYKEVSFLNTSKLIGDSPFIVERQIKDDFIEYEEKLSVINKHISTFKDEYINIRKTQFDVQETSLNSTIQNIQSLLSKYEDSNEFYNKKLTNGIFYKLISFYSTQKKEILKDQNLLSTSFSELKNKSLKFSDLATFQLANSILENKSSLINYKTELESIKKGFNKKINNEFNELNFLQPISKEFESSTFNKLMLEFKSLIKKIEEQEWSVKTIDKENHKKIISSIEHLINCENDFFNNENDVFTIEFKWFQFYNSLTKKEKTIIDQLKEQEDWKKSFLIFYYKSLLTFSSDGNLPTDDNDLVELVETLTKLEKEQIKYIVDYWFSNQLDAARNFNNNKPGYTVENLFNKRASKNHRRLSLRQIVKTDIDLFTTFFPIILTTPDVASNLFTGKNKYFDIVMFDEASQLKLEDNLPALLKGKQIIIAGDEHQMPPSNYFSKIFDGTIDDEDEFDDENDLLDYNLSNSLLDCESLLEFASILGFDKRYLDFHYRSKHPYLIDFSNYAFYNQRLKPLPNEFDYVPINYINVNGTYSGNSNEAEAETILSIIENNILRLPNGQYPTVGIATFNINQRNLILSKINERRKFSHFKEFNDKIIELEENGLFVKNLENIQGDERDVIILSTTYGINKDGKFAHRFGAINHLKGYKLLNVIITRAKYKIYVCTSVPENVFLNYKDYLVTEGSNNRRGVFFAYLSYAKAVSENNNELRLSILNNLAENSTNKSNIDEIPFSELESPFEEEVYAALLDYFDKDNLIPQFQFAGFRIDIVYDSKKIGIPKIAIECDGAKYHSSQEAYLYDLHRQKILESHGFVFHRIWSTNWWRNPKNEIKKLVQFINNIENNKSIENIETQNLNDSFLDETSTITAKESSDTVKQKEDAENTIKVLKEDIQVELFKETIKLNDKVKVRYLNIDKDLSVQLVDKTINKHDKSGDIQKINIKSKLGVALVGKSVDDTIKIGDTDTFVKILEIKSN